MQSESAEGWKLRMRSQRRRSGSRTDKTVTGELFQWSYRHLNENANNLMKGLERLERENERETLKENREGNECEVEDRESWVSLMRGKDRWRNEEERREDGQKKAEGKGRERQGSNKVIHG